MKGADPKMNIKKTGVKLTSAICALSILLTPALTSCGQEKEEQESVSTSNTKVTSTTYEYTIDSLPELDFQNQQFGIYGVRGSMGYLIAEEETGDLVNDAVFRRNTAIEDKYNLDFLMVEAAPNVGIPTIRKLILSGDNTYQVYQSVQHNAMPEMILQNYFVDWNELKNIDYTKPYWNSKIAKDINFGGKVYTMTGDINLYAYNSTNCILFNKRLFDDLGIDYPYQDVYDKTWTIEKFLEIEKQGYKDLNGDQQWDEETDRLGYAGWIWEMYYALFMGMGGKVLINGENNEPVLVIGSEHNVEIIDKIIEIFDGKNAWASAVVYEAALDIFRSGRMLMKDSFITEINMNRSSEFEVGMLPYPMYDEDQGEYYSRTANIAYLSYIPTTNKILDETGIILEAMAIESYNRLRPVYYDVTLDQKASKDEETPDMIDIVIETGSYLPEGFLYVDAISRCVESQQNTFASWNASLEKQFQKTAEQMTKFYCS